MVELTEREKKIVLIKFIIHGENQFKHMPLETRVTMLETACKIYGIQYNEQEFLDIGQAILGVQEDLNKSLVGFLNVNKDLFKSTLKNFNVGKDLRLR
jgi:hypothetical protein